MSLIGKRTVSTLRMVLPKLTDFSKNNLQFIDKIDVTIYNPNTVSKNSVFRKNMYESNVCFINRGMYVQKKFENDNFEHMINDVNNFIDNEYTSFDI